MAPVWLMGLSPIWSINVELVVIVIVLIIMTVKNFAQPPRSIPEGVFEAHKVVLVGNVNFAGVGIIETLLLAPKLTHDQLSLIALGQQGLIICLIFGALLLVCAFRLAPDETNCWAKLPYTQIVAGLILFGVVAYVFYFYKSIDDDLVSHLMAAVESK